MLFVIFSMINFTRASDSDWTPLVRGWRNRVIPIQYREWSLSFELFLKTSAPANKWVNIIRIGKGGNRSEIRDRYPALFLAPNSTDIYFTLSDDMSGVYNNQPYSITTNKWLKIQVTQKEDAGILRFESWLNDELLHSRVIK